MNICKVFVGISIQKWEEHWGYKSRALSVFVTVTSFTSAYVDCDLE